MSIFLAGYKPLLLPSWRVSMLDQGVDPPVSFQCRVLARTASEARAHAVSVYTPAVVVDVVPWLNPQEP